MTSDHEGERLTGRFAGFSVTLHPPGIYCVRFGRSDGRLNGLTAATKRDLVEFMTAAQLARDARVLIFTGGDGVFSAGDDFEQYHEGKNWVESRTADIYTPGRPDQLGLYNRLRLGSQQLTRTIRDTDLLTIAAIDGPCIQSAFTFALGCDFRIVTPRARLGSATLRFGYLPDENGHYLLVQHLGVARTLDLVMNNRLLSGDEAFGLGLASAIVDPADLESSALQMAERLAQGPQVAMRILKRAIYRAAESTFDQAADDIATKTALSDFSPDTREGVRAWKERRPPRFNQWDTSDTDSKN